MGATTNAETIRRHLHQVAARADAELGDERPAFVAGCPSLWNELPHPEGADRSRHRRRLRPRLARRVATSFVESTVNLLVGKRFAKRQRA